MADGEKIFSSMNCDGCHGGDGSGWVGPNLADGRWRYGGADVKGLVATGNWRDERSAGRYSHAVARDEWKRVEDLPAIGKKQA